jgi:hypothetical protein
MKETFRNVPIKDVIPKNEIPKNKPKAETKGITAAQIGETEKRAAGLVEGPVTARGDKAVLIPMKEFLADKKRIEELNKEIGSS